MNKKEQLFGFKCGPKWCEVGGHGMFSSGKPKPKLGGYPGKPYWHRVYQVKGWFDEQQLEETSGVNPKPSKARGTVYPDPGLDGRAKGSYEQKWLPAARVVLDKKVGYEGKLKAYPYPAGQPFDEAKMNLVEMCWDHGGDCKGVPFILREKVAANGCGPGPTEEPKPLPEDAGAWWARITPLGETGQESKYFCVRRRDHLGYSSPGTARWRWRSNDETIWMSCSAGCCEVEI